MDKRKIIGFGKNSFVVSLPKKWVISNNLQKGDSVYVTNLPFELKITPAEISEKKETKTTLIQTDKKTIAQIKSEVISTYLNATDIIEIRGKNLSVFRKEIKAIINKLSGMEIIEIEIDKIVAKDLIDISEVSIATLVKRIDMSLRSMLEDLHKYKADQEKYEYIMERDEDINRMVFLAYRVMNRAILNPLCAVKLDLSTKEIITTGLIIIRQEKIGDQIKRIFRYARDKSITDDERKKLNELFVEIKQAYLTTMKAYYNKDEKLALSIEVGNIELIKKTNKFLNKNSQMSMAIVVNHTKSMISSIKHIARTITGGIG